MRRESSEFRRLYDALDRLETTVQVFNPAQQHVARVQANGDGETFVFGNIRGVMLSTENNWASSSEFESVVAHEFAHAAAGIQGGTPAACYSPQGGAGQEACAVSEQNKVHSQLGFRAREGYADTGPFKSKAPPASAKKE
jgi:hypothetical protein